MADEAWVTVALRVEGAEAIARAEALFERFGAHAVCLDEPGEMLLEPAPGAMPLAPRMRVSGLFPADFDPAPLSRALAEELPGTVPQVERLGDDWREALIQRPEPLRFGRLEILPEGTTGKGADRIRIWLAPGLGFGTGHHPTTALCLEALARSHLEGARVLDYGCGSGILAIAALKLGAESAVAVDHDPQALLATATNARRNRLASRLRVLPPERLRLRPRFDLIVANILAETLVALAPRLLALRSACGLLILSGILCGQEKEVLQAYAPALVVHEQAEREGWMRLTLGPARV